MSVKRGGRLSAWRRVLRALTSCAFASLALLLGAHETRAATETPPAPTRWVTDSAGFLSESARASLDQRLEAYERQTGHQVLVWIGATLNGVPIEDFTVHAFEKWRAGRKGIDDGLVLFVFAQDRRMRIEVGYGLEDRVPDAIASRIIRGTIAPQLQAGNRDAALAAGVEAILAAIDGGVAGGAAGEEPGQQASGAPYAGARRETPAASLGQKILIGIVIIGFLILLVTNPRLAIWILFNILASGGRGGSGGGGFGGSSFSGGGGRSGGGGASGSW